MAKNTLATLQADQTCDMSLAGSGGDFLRRVKLCAPLTKEVQEGQAKDGEFFLSGVESLGPEFLATIVKARPHALRLVDGGSKVEMESFDMNSKEFQEIKASKDENPFQQEPSDMYGYDYLLWLPEEKTFATIYLAKTALWKSVPQFQKCLGQLSVISSREEVSKKSKKKYRVPTAVLADEGADVTMPTEGECKAALDLFNNPKPQTGQAAEPAAKKGAKPAAKAGGRKGR